MSVLSSTRTILCWLMLTKPVLSCEPWEPSNPSTEFETHVNNKCNYKDKGLLETPGDVQSATEFLDLAYNKLKTLDSSLLSHVTSLKVINLQQNELTAFPDFTFCKDTIEVINAPDNFIDSLNLSNLVPLKALRRLILSSNDIAMVEPLKYGQTIPSITFIDLFSNHLKWFPKLCQTSDLQIILTYNILECGACFLWLNNCPYDIDWGKEDLKCDTPSDLKGRLLTSVTAEELKMTECPITFDEDKPVTRSESKMASALYRKSTEWTEGSVILPISSSSSKLQCAVYCLRYGGESFDYNQADNGCFVYAQKTGWYQVIQ